MDILALLVVFSCKAGNPFFPQEEEDLQLAVLEHCVPGLGLWFGALLSYPRLPLFWVVTSWPPHAMEPQGWREVHG